MLEPVLPDKTFFSMGEVSRILQVKPYILRYWEKEMGLIRPARRESGQRKFTRSDVLLISRVKDLLYEKGLTIAGARRQLLEERRDRNSPESKRQKTEQVRQSDLVKQIYRELKDIAQCLKD